MKRAISIFLISALLLLSAGCAKQNVETLTPEPTPTATETPSSEPRKEAAFVSTREPTRSDISFMVSKNDKKITVDSDTELPEYLDVISISKQIDDKDIYFFITVRGIPESVTINNEGLSNVLEYCWYISFDVDGNNEVTYNATFNHHRFNERGKEESQAAIDSDEFETVVLQHQTRSDYTVAEGEFLICENEMVFHISKNNNEDLMKISEETPFFILSEARTYDTYFVKIVPLKQGD